MINGKTITLFGCAWGNYIQPTQEAIDHTILLFNVFDKVYFKKDINSSTDFNKYMVEDLSKDITTDFVLTVQSDGFVLNPDKWDNNFLLYDYIGAPWPWYMACGNGGFSLRSKRFLEESSKLKYDPAHHEYAQCPEDYFLCIKNKDYFIGKGIKFPSIDLASKFSFEHPIYKNRSIKDSFGFHGKHNL